MRWSTFSTLVLASVYGAMSAAAAGPSACVSFDINWNLLAFGFNGKDYNAGTQDTWTSSSAPTDITTSGRPPFNAVNTTCYLSQFANAIYVLNADTANPSAVYIYDATAKTWSMQAVDAGKFDPTDFATILDHDTNVFYSYSKGEMFSLDMQLLKAAQSSPIPWNDVQQPDLSSNQASDAGVPGANSAGYQPVMALAQNHIHFLGIPGFPAGTAKIFVIHFSFMQPTPQSYGAQFPSTHGQAASFFLDQGVQQEFAFIPDDGSNTYVINVETNTTKTLTGPLVKDPFATYSASTTALVQLTSDGKVAFLAYDPKATTSGGTWASISKLPNALSTSGSGSSGSGSSGSGSSGTGLSGSGNGNSGSGSSGGSSGNQTGNNANNHGGALGLTPTSMGGLWVGLVMGLVGVLGLSGL
ncbi:hypothetical protein BJ165DRAFT_1483332 [Panaeolus papilionaceus]|nr:hypothetical protein BJ165DRAFT_1483332 [Panaeolus papilionaceus]